MRTALPASTQAGILNHYFEVAMFFKAVLNGLLISFLLTGVMGCAEGPLWRTGYLSPWVRQKWQEEEQIAATMFTRRADLRKKVDQSVSRNAEAQNETAIQLGEIVAKDPVSLMRIEAARLLGDLPVPAAGDALKVASRDNDASVRKAAIQSLGRRTDDNSAQLLANLCRADDNLDVRIAATRQLGNFRGNISLEALGDALSHPNPAMQLTAAEALKRTTGNDFGNDIQAWQRFVDNRLASPVVADSVSRANETGGFRR